jgi:predicted nucleic acid-binding protein
LQGIKDNKSYEATKLRLSRLPFIDTNKETYLSASSLYRALRRKGITVPPVDTTITALATQNQVPLFTGDSHFMTIARHSKLKLY